MCGCLENVAEDQRTYHEGGALDVLSPLGQSLARAVLDRQALLHRLLQTKQPTIQDTRRNTPTDSKRAKERPSAQTSTAPDALGHRRRSLPCIHASIRDVPCTLLSTWRRRMGGGSPRASWPRCWPVAPPRPAALRPTAPPSAPNPGSAWLWHTGERAQGEGEWRGDAEEVETLCGTTKEASQSNQVFCWVG